MHQELSYAHNWLADGHSIVMAVVSETWGSAPRPKGSLMIIHADGRFEGSVSGGCVEGSVIAEATALMGTTTSKTLNFTVSSEDAWQIGLACGGKIQIQLFPISVNDTASFTETLNTCNNRCSGELRLTKQKCCATFNPTHTPSASKSLMSDDDEALTLHIQPNPRLFVVGAVHITQALIPMSIACGYEVTVIDPRGLFVEKRHFSGATIIQDWPDEFFSSSPLDSTSALVTLTHDPKIDDAALVYGLESDAFYIGSLGSKKTHASRLKRLENQGIDKATLKRVHGPIGLNISAKSPAEIAVSIMAELTAARRGINAV